MEQISDYGACRNLGLQDVATAIGLPGKIGGQGSEVAAMVARGEIEQVRAYCEADCLNLFVLYVRWALLSGKTDAAGHDASLASLVRCLEEERETARTWASSSIAGGPRSRPAPMSWPEDRPRAVAEEAVEPAESGSCGLR